MEKIRLADVTSLHEYEKTREASRRRVIATKRRRRVAVGDRLSFLFENRETVPYEQLPRDLINAVVATGKPIVMSVRSTATTTVLLASEYGESSGVMFGHSDHSEHGHLTNGLMIERHIRLPDVETPDTKFSSTPDEFRDYVKRIRGLKR